MIITKRYLAELLDRERVAYTDADLRVLQTYFNGRRTVAAFDTLDAWVKMCVDILEPKLR